MKPWQSALPIPIVERDYFRAVLRLLEEADREGSANLVLMGIEPTYPSEKAFRCLLWVTLEKRVSFR